MICIFLFCPAGNSLVSSCEGLTKYGSFVYVDFYKINRPCTCIVTTMFDGTLLVISWAVVQVCNTQIVIDKSLIMGCPLQHLSSQALGVQMNELVEVQAEYISPYTSGTFYHCLGFQQNGKIDSIFIIDLIILLCY